MEEIFAVVWSDFGVPLSLRYRDRDEARKAAMAMHEKGTLNHIRVGRLRAVYLSADDKLETIWEPETEC